jgi:FAD/FMN-containing dehydrogenase
MEQSVLEQAAEQLNGNFRGEVLRAGDAGYDEARKVFNAMFDRRPALIARCAGVADVMAAVEFARESGLQVAVRGGGHGVPGYAVCDEGIVIDLTPMKGIWVDPAGEGRPCAGGRDLGRVRP